MGSIVAIVAPAIMMRYKSNHESWEIRFVLLYTRFQKHSHQGRHQGIALRN